MDELPALIETVIVTYYARLYGYCFRLLGHAQDADNAVQELSVTVVVLAVQDGRLPPEGVERDRWLFTLARHACLTIRAQRRRHPHRGLPAGEGWHPTGESDVDALHDAEAVQAALESLSTEHQTVLGLISKGYTTAEMAVSLGIPQGSVSARVKRAKAALLNRLNADFG